eukprot:g18358.t1
MGGFANVVYIMRYGIFSSLPVGNFVKLGVVMIHLLDPHLAHVEKGMDPSEAICKASPGCAYAGVGVFSADLQVGQYTTGHFPKGLMLGAFSGGAQNNFTQSGPLKVPTVLVGGPGQKLPSLLIHNVVLGEYGILGLNLHPPGYVAEGLVQTYMFAFVLLGTVSGVMLAGFLLTTKNFAFSSLDETIMLPAVVLAYVVHDVVLVNRDHRKAGAILSPEESAAMIENMLSVGGSVGELERHGARCGRV